MRSLKFARNQHRDRLEKKGGIKRGEGTENKPGGKGGKIKAEFSLDKKGISLKTRYYYYGDR